MFPGRGEGHGTASSLPISDRGWQGPKVRRPSRRCLTAPRCPFRFPPKARKECRQNLETVPPDSVYQCRTEELRPFFRWRTLPARRKGFAAKRCGSKNPADSGSSEKYSALLRLRPAHSLLLLVDAPAVRAKPSRVGLAL